MVYATSESLTFSSTNSSMSAYCRFKYSRQFFSRYSLSDKAQQQEETLGPTGQLGTKVWTSVSSAYAAQHENLNSSRI